MADDDGYEFVEPVLVEDGKGKSKWPTSHSKKKKSTTKRRPQVEFVDASTATCESIKASRKASKRPKKKTADKRGGINPQSVLPTGKKSRKSEYGKQQHASTLMRKKLTAETTHDLTLTAEFGTVEKSAEKDSNEDYLVVWLLRAGLIVLGVLLLAFAIFLILVALHASCAVNCISSMAKSYDHKCGRNTDTKKASD